jgi:hypothetical protein
MTIEQKLRKPVESQVARKGFAGREGLADGLASLVEHNDEARKILAAHTVKETVLAIVRAIRVKNAFEDLIIREAQAILQGRNSGTKPAGRKSQHDTSSLEGVVCAALERMGMDSQVSLHKKGSGSSGEYSIFIINSATGSDKVMLKDAILSETEPVSSAEKMLRLQGVGIDRSTPQSVPSSRRRAADLVDLKREDLDARKIGFHGNQDGGLNHFTYLETGMESTFCVRPELKGTQLLNLINKRIVQLHASYNMRLSSQVAETFSQDKAALGGLERIIDPELKKAARTLLMLATDYNEEIVPLEYREGCRRIRESGEFYQFIRNENEGVLSAEDIAVFSRAFEEIDHPGHRMVRNIWKSITAQGRDINDDEREVLRSTLAMNSGGKSDLSPKVLGILAEAYSMISNEDVSSWDDGRRARKHLDMAFRLRKAVAALGSCLKVMSNDEAGEETEV